MDAAAISDALQRLAPKLAPGGGEIAALRRLSGGANMETWAFDVGAGASAVPCILRRRAHPMTPREVRFNIDLVTEARVLRAAARHGVAVAAVRWICEPGDGLGEGYVMERLNGEALGGRIVRKPEFAAVRGRLAYQCGELLGRIHRVPLAELPPLRRTCGVEEAVTFESIYREIGSQRPIFEAAFRYLEDAAPPAQEPVLLHGDYRNGNLMVDPATGLRAALDWEMCHIGEPGEDLGWLCANSWRYGQSGKPVGGFGSYEQLLEGYAAGGGAAMSVERLRYWEVFGSLKWAVLCRTMYEIFVSDEEHSVERSVVGRRTSEAEIDLVHLLGSAP
ncbi:MAG: phosphotransferase family protein [Nevskia sp.]|nr:phosphotransferase family protein [Nevskia sp.]